MRTTAAVLFGCALLLAWLGFLFTVSAQPPPPPSPADRIAVLEGIVRTMRQQRESSDVTHGICSADLAAAQRKVTQLESDTARLVDKLKEKEPEKK